MDFLISRLASMLERSTTETEGSGFIISKVKGIYIHFCVHAATQGNGNYVGYPRGVSGRREVFNPKDERLSCVVGNIAAFKIRRPSRPWRSVNRKLRDT